MAQQADDWRARYELAKHSVLYIQFAPKPGMVGEIQRIADRVMSIVDDEERHLAVENPSTCIGFVHGSTGDDRQRQVMTTAHALKHVYSWGDPLTVDKTELFRASVVCYHQEEERRQASMPEEARRYAEAKIMASAWAQDILVLTVGVQDLRGLHDDEACPAPHPALPVAPSMPRTAMRCMLLAWPAANGPPRGARGWTSSRRGVGMMSTNDLGYRMTLLEVYVDSLAGMSGAPLLDAGGRVVGMLHEGFGGTHSYFVASPHLYRWRQNQPRTPRFEVVE